MVRRLALCVALFLCLLQESGLCGIVVFGDSLSDAGNTFLLTSPFVPGLLPAPIPNPAFGYESGAFTNGPNWIDAFAGSLGEVTPRPSQLSGGTNFAHGGAQFGTSAFFRPSLSEQVAAYRSQVPAPNATDIHILFGGANDLLEAPTDATATQIPLLIAATVGELYNAGARRFVVLNLPQLGFVPLASTPSYAPGTLNGVARLFNVNLAEQLGLLVNRPGIELTLFDTASFLQEAINNPSAFGFSNVSDAAAPFDAVGSAFLPAGLATAAPSAGVDPNSFLFFDGLHPSSAAHLQLGLRVASAIPEPASFAGFAALLILGVRRRRFVRPAF